MPRTAEEAQLVGALPGGVILIRHGQVQQRRDAPRPGLPQHAQRRGEGPAPRVQHVLVRRQPLLGRVLGVLALVGLAEVRALGEEDEGVGDAEPQEVAAERLDPP